MSSCQWEEEQGGKAAADLLMYVAPPSPSELLVAGADAEKPLEGNEAVIGSRPAGTNGASVTGAVILTLLAGSQLESSNQSRCAWIGWPLHFPASR